MNASAESPLPQALHDLVYQKVGLKIDSSRFITVQKTLNNLMATTGIKSIDDLLATLGITPTSDDIWSALIDAITIGETYFFRNSDQFNALRNHILPQIITQRRESGFRHISIWSAGCATGEEPYSIAMLLRELLPDFQSWTYFILATDINPFFLETARRGVYRARSFREETPAELRNRWFKDNGTSYELDPSIRKMVVFAPLNLISDQYPSFESRTMNMDIIVCRNVTIYFNEETTRSVVKRFYNALNNDGWLVVGHAEPLMSVYQDFTIRNFPNAVIYQKSVMPQLPPQLPTVNRVNNKAAVKPKTAPLPTPHTITAKNTAPDIDALMLEAQQSADREDWVTLADQLKQIEKAAPLNARAHYLRALMLMHQNQLEAATVALRRAIYCDASFALAHYVLGEVQAKRGSKQDARRSWSLARQALNGMALDQDLALTGELTVEMLLSLLDYRLASEGV